MTLRALGDRRLRAIVQRFADSFERGDVGAILDLLTEDVAFAMPPYPEWCRGRDAVAGSWLMPSGGPGSLRYAPARANGQLALGRLSDRARAAATTCRSRSTSSSSAQSWSRR